MASNQSSDAASAVNRFGLGARPGEIERMHAPREALAAQLKQSGPMPTPFNGLPGSSDMLRLQMQYLLQRREFKQSRKDQSVGAPAEGVKQRDPQLRQIRSELKQALTADDGARWAVAATTDSGFVERIVRFWSNHFAVSVDKKQALPFASVMERDVIREHAFGNFRDLLVAVESHPAMLVYLDNVRSIGPDSQFASRRANNRRKVNAAGGMPRNSGLNENLAREIMELHTLGVDDAYTQADVVEFARAITGWSMPRNNADGVDGWFVFRPQIHQPGARKVLGKTYAEGGVEQGRAIMADLAINPGTAKHLAFKLARHFVADQPPPSLVQRMAKRYLDSGGNLTALYTAMIGSDEAWSPNARKFRTPEDFLIASVRATSVPADGKGLKLSMMQTGMGQPPFGSRSPAGFPDIANAWIGPDPILKRIQAANLIAARTPRGSDPNAIASAALGVHLRASTAQAVDRADSPQQATAVLLASPDFQWRI